MEFENIYQTIISEPIYLSIAVIFILITVYSILKKFFKLLIVVLSILLIYIVFLIYTGEDLPGESEDFIHPMIDQAEELIKNASDKLQELSKD
jgi:Ca2+/Na+ antiporter